MGHGCLLRNCIPAGCVPRGQAAWGTFLTSESAGGHSKAAGLGLNQCRSMERRLGLPEAAPSHTRERRDPSPEAGGHTAVGVTLWPSPPKHENRPFFLQGTSGPRDPTSPCCSTGIRGKRTREEGTRPALQVWDMSDSIPARTTQLLCGPTTASPKGPADPGSRARGHKVLGWRFLLLSTSRLPPLLLEAPAPLHSRKARARRVMLRPGQSRN